jgi:hypothetical protein
VAPAEHVWLYEFFRPELRSGSCTGKRVVLAITPAASITDRKAAITHLMSAGYEKDSETVVGRSGIIWFSRSR